MQREDFHKHLDLLQGIISRMAGNSASCKNYCVTLTAALLALDQIKTDKSLTFLAIIPILIFAFLDAYYLYLETHLRGQYNAVVEKWQTNTLTQTDLFSFAAPHTGWAAIKDSFYQILSLSVGVFYGFLGVIIGALTWFLSK